MNIDCVSRKQSVISANFTHLAIKLCKSVSLENWTLTMAPTPAPKYHPPPVHPKLRHTPAPNAQPTLRVYNQSCRAKQSESTGKTAGASARPPFSAVGGPARAPKAQITCHIMRGLAQQALLLFLSLSLTHTRTQTDGPAAALLLKSCSVLFCSLRRLLR